MSTGKVVKSGMWIYVGGLATNIVGYAYWLIASQFVGPEVVGSASAIIALQGLLVVAVSLGLPTGLRRFIGEHHSKQDFDRVGSYFFANLIIMSMLSLVCIVPLIIAYQINQGILGISSIDLGFVAFLVLLNSLTPIFVSLFDSMLRTKITASAQVISALVKITLGYLLLLMNFGFLAIMVAFLLSTLIADFILIGATYLFFRNKSLKINIDQKVVRDLVTSGLPAWLPNMLTIAGQSFAVLIVYNIVGDTETGLYYIAYAIAAVVYAAPTSILGLMYPVLSGMEDGRKESITKMTRIAVALTAPFAVAVVVFSNIPFMILGPLYMDAAPLLSWLAIGAIAYPIYAGYYSYAYAIKQNRHVLTLGISINGSRLVLYVLLASIFGAMGVAMGYTLGIVVGLFAMVISSSLLDYRPPWLTYGKTVIIPCLFGIVLYYFQIHWLLAVPIIVLLSTIIYTRSNIISREDAIEIINAFMSPISITRFYVVLRPVSVILFGK